MIRAILAAVAILLVVTVCAVQPERVSGWPRVVDGDTLHFPGGPRVRLAGSDAPEIDAPGGVRARWELMKLIAGQRVTCVTTTARRTYERWIARCALESGADLDAAMIARGVSKPHRN